MIFKKTVLAAFAAFALTSGVSQAQNLVQNGSFEANSQAAGTWNIYSSLTGWTGSPNIELRNNVAGSAQDGVNYVELDTTRNSSMFQDIVAGGLVELSFWYSARPGTFGLFNSTNELDFSFGSLAGTVLSSASNLSGANQWHRYTGTVDLGGYGAHRLTFAADGYSNSYGGSLDNISVTAVPEPETYAMMLAGLGLMGTIARRRKQKLQNV